MRRIYGVLYALLLPVVLLRLWWRGRRNPAYRLRWQERLGRYSTPPPDGAPLWIHAVSVGEVAATVPLVRALRDAEPTRPILFSTTTPTGRDAVERQFGQGVHHVYFPYDLEAVVDRFLGHFRPRALVLMETELWPNLLAICRARGLPVYLANGRLSPASARRYALLRPLVREMLHGIACAAVQTTADAERFSGLGMRPERIVVTGSLKFDIHVPASVYEEGAAIRRELGQSRPLFMAGSTRAGEEESLLDALAMIKAVCPDVLLVLAPRHPERFDDVAELCRRRGFGLQLRSAGMACGAAVEVFLLDAMGEMMRFYAACDVAFVGGSLVPLGGHNVLEPAALGVPVVVGPHLFNFQDIAHKLFIGGSLKVAHDVNDIASIVVAWLTSSDLRDSAGRSGRAIVEANRGATRRVLAIVSTRDGLMT
ncbi:MAG: lipid IV(A) 3-deoxy-D-manno-octulosonic acid transferase [Gammaproteobacteria bacterium]